MGAVLALLLLLLTTWAPPGFAQTAPAAVLLDNRPVISVSGSGDLSERERANLIANRLERALELGQRQVRTVESGGDLELRAGPLPLLTVTAVDAAVAGLSVEALGERWASELSAALARTAFERTRRGQVQAITLAVTFTGIALGLSWLIGRLRGWLALNRDGEPRLLVTDFLRQAVWPVQLAVWGVWLYAVSGLFVFSRPVRNVLASVFSGELVNLLVAAAAAWLVIRLGNRFVDTLLVEMQENRPVTGGTPRLGSRLRTFGLIFKRTFAALIVLLALLYVLGNLGFNVAPLLAGLGVFGLSLGLGAQNVVKDVVNGTLILFEDQYGIDDVITINGDANLSGRVEDLNLRITRLRDGQGRLVTVPHNIINTVANHTSGPARLEIPVQLAWGEDLASARALLQQQAEALRTDPDWEAKILSAPAVSGPADFSADGPRLQVVLDTQPLVAAEVGAELRTRITEAFGQAGIRFAGQTVEGDGRPG
jgi:small conductance mechanosensitive channel